MGLPFTVFKNQERWATFKTIHSALSYVKNSNFCGIFLQEGSKYHVTIKLLGIVIWNNKDERYYLNRLSQKEKRRQVYLQCKQTFFEKKSYYPKYL